ncbi:hypothetical protein KTT_10260 [Tengunoibacter tsumagoiensis]|uniref:Uncharacterized protein n=1 Tax=Tengunoibacter tsumagoiensis TaxID=2014871 RepID=A0A401ZWD3_9CHLR|nr:hypothetical protein KTT_10260 [Tengunoibacter tsumagoiensis]
MLIEIPEFQPLDAENFGLWLTPQFLQISILWKEELKQSRVQQEELLILLHSPGYLPESNILSYPEFYTRLHISKRTIQFIKTLSPTAHKWFFSYVVLYIWYSYTDNSKKVYARSQLKTLLCSSCYIGYPKKRGRRYS